MSGTIKGITIEIGGNTTKLTSALSKANKSIKSTQSELNNVNKALKFDPTNIDLLRDKQKLLGDRVTETKAKLDALKQAQAQMDASGVDKNSEEYRKLETEIDITESKLKNLEKAQKKFGSAGAQKIAAIGEKVKSVGDTVSSVGTTLSKHVTAPIVAVGAAATASFKEVDEAMDTVATKTGASGEALEGLQQNAKNIAETIPTSFQTAAEAVGGVNTRFGLTGQECEDLSTKFVEFANINDTDVSTSVDNVQKSLEAFGQDASDAGNLMDALSKVSQNTGIDVDTLSQDLISNAAQFTAMGMSAEQAAGVLGECEKSGVDTSTMLKGLKTAQKNATDQGLSLSDALSGFSDTMNSNASDTDKLQAAYDLFGTKAGAAIYNACATGSISIDDLSGDLGDFGGTVENTFNDTLDPIDQMQLIMNTLKDTGADLAETAGEILVPVFQKLADWAKDLKEKWEGLSPEQQQMIEEIAAIVAVIGPLLVVGGKMIIGIGQIMTAAPLLASAFSALAGPVGIVIAAIAGAVAVGILLYKNWDTIKEKAQTTWNNIKNAIQNSAVGQAVGQVWSTAKQDMQSELDAMSSAYTAHGGGIKGAVAAVGAGIKQGFQNCWNNANQITGGKLGEIASSVQAKMASVKNHVSNALESVRGFFTSKLGSAFSTTQSKFSSIASTIRDKMSSAKSKVSSALESIKGYFANCQLSLPNIKLPHFSLSGEFSLKNKTVPHLSVDWYDKGGIFTSPSIIGVGEKRPEFVGALDDLRKIVREESGGGELMQQLIEISLQNQALLAQKQNVYLNGRELTRSLKTMGVAFE